jgi:glycine/D-amino acid oxidase-like deaminating enzyme
VGLYNDAPAMLALARASAEVYDSFPHAFRRAGGIEVATTEAGAAELARRAESARGAGLSVAEIGGADVMRLAPDVVDTDRMVAAWAYPDDGVAYTRLLIQAIRSEARTRGARFIDGAAVVGIEPDADGGLLVRAEGAQQVPADAVVLCGGIWAPSLAAFVGVDLPLFPVAHPYVYSAAREELQSGSFVRWPEHHVYARVHSDRLGLGTYDHIPVSVSQSDLAHGAELEWPEEAFDDAIAKAEELLPVTSRFAPDNRVNAVFAVTPDNLPMLGPVGQIPGVWSAQALWVTHAAGAAKVLAAAITEGEALPQELDPARFAARNADELRASALRLYRDIYANDVFPGRTPIGESSRSSCSS